MSTASDHIAEIAYTELVIACAAPGCSSIFEPSLSEPATDPVEAWAVDMAGRARQAGWRAGPLATVLCPAHSEQLTD